MRTLVLERGPVFRRRILLVLTAGVPLLFFRFTNDPINVPKLALLTTGLALVVAIRAAELIQGAPWEGLKRVWIPATAFALPLFIGWIAAPYKGWSLMGAYIRYQGLVPYLLCILFGVLIADAFDRTQVEQVAWAFVGAATVSAVYAVMQRIGVDPLEWAAAGRTTSDATSTLGNSNFTGAYLGMALPLVAGLAVLNPARRPILGAVGFVVALGWILAESQGAWAAGVAGVIGFGGIVLSSRYSWARLAGLAMAALITVATVGAILVNLEQEPNPDGRAGTAAVRAFAWKAASDQILDHPVVGQGPNSFALLGIQHRSIEDAITFDTNFPDDPHSVLLSLGTAAGILGLVGAVIAIGWVLVRGAGTDATNVLGAAFFGAVIAYVVQALVSLDEISIRVGFWSAVGGLVAASVSPPERKTVPGSKKRKGKRATPENRPLKAAPAVIALGLIPLAALVWSGRLVLADAKTHWGFSKISVDPAAGVADLRSASDLRPDPYYDRKLGEGATDAAVATEDPSLFETAETGFDALGDLPYYPGLIAKADGYDKWSQIDAAATDSAVKSYEELVELDPLNPHLRVRAADVLVDAGQTDEALEVLQPAIDDAGEYLASVWGELAVIRYEQQDLAGAEDAMNRAFELDPSEPQASAVEEALNGEGDG